MRKLEILSSLTLTLSSLWLGPYFLSTLHMGHWAILPTAFTALMFLVIGIFWFTWAVRPSDL